MKQKNMSRADELRAELAGLRAKGQESATGIEHTKEALTAALLAGNDKQADALEVQLADALKAAGRAEVREQGLLHAITEAERQQNAEQRAAIIAELDGRMAERAALVDGIATRLDALAAELESVLDCTLSGRYWGLLELRPAPNEIPTPPSFASLHQVARRIAQAAADSADFADDLHACRTVTRNIATERERRGTSVFDEGVEHEAFIAANPMPELPRMTWAELAGKYLGFFVGGKITTTSEPKAM